MSSSSEDAVASMRHIEAEVLRLLRRVRQQALANARVVHPELQGSGYGVLLYVLENEPVRASEVVEALGMDKGAVSRQVHHLAELGLLSSTEDPDDRRAHRLVLSEEGQARVALLRDRRREELERRLSSWSPEALRVFAEKLAEYNASFES